MDAVEVDEKTGRFRIAKSPTTPSDPTTGFLNAVEKLGTPLDETNFILHGTTLGVNAIIQHKGVRTGIISNEGFRDIFEVGRGDVPASHMYDYNYLKPKRLVKRRQAIGVPCRIDYRGDVLQELDEQALKTAARYLIEEQQVQSIAISFLHSYKNNVHEKLVESIMSKMYPDVSISISSDVVSEYREYERTSTTVLDAYIKPLVAGYLQKLERALLDRGFQGILLIMRSDGGVMSASVASKSPISTVQSGPAGGVVGAIRLAKLLDRNKMITMDIGGTSLDVCVIEDCSARVVHQTYVDNYPMLLTMYDIRSIGAGGGSIASVKNGLLQVGPESAGADPGPMCYDRGGTKPTVTDAAVILGFIDPANFLLGEMILRQNLSHKGIESQIAQQLGVNITDAAAGIMKVTATNSMGAIRQITVEEGRDPADFSLLAFGGAGPLFAAIIAKELKIPEVIIPNVPAAFSAWGMLMSNISYEVSQTYISLLEGNSHDKIATVFAPLESKVRSILGQQNHAYKEVLVEKRLELRYFGQEHTLEVSIGEDSTIQGIRQSFDDYHLKRYGHKMMNQVETVNLRTRGIGVLESPVLQKLSRRKENSKVPVAERRQAYCLITDEMKEFSILRRDNLLAGDHIEGPAIVDEGVSRTVIHTGQQLSVDDLGNLIMTT